MPQPAIEPEIVALAGGTKLRIVYRPLDSLRGYERNARTHSPAQIAQIAASIAEFGFTNPLLIDERGGIIAGHGRLLAARQAGMAEVPTITLTGLTATQRKALVIADNKLTLSAGWDDDLLRAELSDLRDEGFDLDLTGFGADEIAALLSEQTSGLTDPDEVPATPEHPVSALGDVWILGRHRLVCGDSTNAEHVALLMNGANADLCFTSPPYAQQRDYKSGGAGDWDALMQGVFAVLPVKDEAQILVNLGLVHRDGEWMPYWDGWIEWMRTQGWRRFGWYVWDQGFGLPGDWKGRLAPSHEFVFHFNRETGRPNKTKGKRPENVCVAIRHSSILRGKDGTKRTISSPDACAQPNKIPDSVIRVMRQQGSLGKGLDHPAVFPVDLVSEMLTAFSDPDDRVYEPFCGSGTQLISAQKNGRSCYGMEIAPAYADVAVKRWQNFTGQQAVHADTGRTFADLAQARAF